MAERPGGEPTEQPTARRLEEARRRGQVARSADLSGAVAMLAGLAALVASGALILGTLAALIATILSGAARGLTPAAAGALAVSAFVRTVAPPLCAVFAAALAVGLMQTRGLLAFASLEPDLGRLSPAKGLARSFGPAATFEVGKGLVKVLVLGAVAWVGFRAQLTAIVATEGGRATGVLATVGASASAVGLRVAVAALALGGLDFLWQLRRHRKELMMTRDEVRREHKESEGDPQHRAERKRLHRELIAQRRLDDVRKADFVVVNPDHIAVAVRYDRDGAGAPVVVARGERLVAEMIKDVAREAGVPVFRDVTLARSLNEVEEGEEIPEALYEAVAELLRVAYGAGTESGGEVDAPAPQRLARPAAGARRV